MSRRSFFVWIAVMSAALFAAGGIAGWVIVDRVVTGPRFKSRVEEAVSAYFQRPFTIEKLGWRWWPHWKLIGYEVGLWDDDSKRQLLAELPRLEVQIPDLSFRETAMGALEMARGRRIFNSLNPVYTGAVHNSDSEVEFRVAIKEEPRFTAAVDLRNARYRSTSFPNVQARVRREGGVYTVNSTKFDGSGGTITAHGSYRPSPSTGSFALEWKTAGVQARDLLRLGGSPVEVSGVLDSEGRLEGGVGDRFLPTLNGEVHLVLKDGWFGNATGLLKIFSKLNVATLVTEASGNHQSRVPFNETRGTVKIADGIASTDKPFVLQNKTLQMAFVGRYDLANRSVDGQVVVHFLLVTDEILSKIPFVREILLRDKKGLTPIWLSVKGNPADPEIKVLAIKSIASPLWNTIANVFRLPKTLVQELTGKK